MANAAKAAFEIPEAEIRELAKKDGITHLSSGIAVLRNGKVLVVRREASDYLGGNYELPGGGVNDGERLLQSITRELREETGLTITEVLGMFPGFDYSTPKKPRVRQCNFLVRAKDDVELSAEHDDAQWVTLADLEGLMLSGFMKECVTNALELADSFTTEA